MYQNIYLKRNKGNVEVRAGGSTDVIADFGATGGLSLVGDLGVTGNTYIGDIAAAGSSYSNNEILVAQSNGKVEYLTTAELKEDIGIPEYWSASSANANAIVNSGMTTSKVGIGTTAPNNELTISSGSGPTLAIGRMSTISDTGVLGNIVFMAWWKKGNSVEINLVFLQPIFIQRLLWY